MAERLLRGLAMAVAGLMILAVVCATVATLLESAASSIAPAKLQRGALTGQLPHLRHVAARHAGQRVGHARVTTRTNRFLLRYRAAGSCRVVVSVSRLVTKGARRLPCRLVARQAEARPRAPGHGARPRRTTRWP